MGHPMYLDRNFEDTLECSVAICEAANKVYKMLKTEYVLFTNLLAKGNILNPNITYMVYHCIGNHHNFNMYKFLT